MAAKTTSRAVTNALVLQFLIFLPLCTILDGGVILSTYSLSVLASWIGIGWMAIRSRGQRPAWMLPLIEFGWIPLTAIAVVLIVSTQGFWQRLGLSNN